MDALSSARLSLRSALPLAVLYVLVIWASYAAGFDEDEIIPIWPAAGILIYAAFRFGWPGLILFGALDFAAAQLALPSHEPAPLIDALFALANIAAVAATMALPGARAAFFAMFERSRAMLWVLAAAASLSSGLSALLALAILRTLSAFALAPEPLLWEVGLRWFLSDYVGTVIAAPLLLAWSRHRGEGGATMSVHLACATVAVAVMLALTVLIPLPPGASRFSLLLGLSPLLLWAALTTSPLGLTALLAVTGTGAAALTIEVIGPASGMRPETAILVVQAYLLAAALSALVVLVSRREQTRLAYERGNLARFFSPRVVELVAAGFEEAGRDRVQDVAVLFIDIRGFTGFAETEAPARVMSVLRGFAARVETRVFDHDGTLDKYLGDGVMATFGVPKASVADARNALACARGLLDDVAEWNRERTTGGEPPIEVGIGIHLGPVVLGTIGSERTKSLSVLGDTVNTASRLQALSRELGTQLVTSGDVVNAVRAEAEPGAQTLLAGLRSAGARPVRGRSAATEIWILDETR